MQPSHTYWHRNERKYADLSPDEIPVTESLQDTMLRTLPLWQSRILPALKEVRNVHESLNVSLSCVLRISLSLYARYRLCSAIIPAIS